MIVKDWNPSKRGRLLLFLSLICLAYLLSFGTAEDQDYNGGSLSLIFQKHGLINPHVLGRKLLATLNYERAHKT